MTLQISEMSAITSYSKMLVQLTVDSVAGNLPSMWGVNHAKPIVVDKTCTGTLYGISAGTSCKFQLVISFWIYSNRNYMFVVIITSREQGLNINRRSNYKIHLV